MAYQSGEPIGVGVNNTLPIFNSRNLPNMVSGVDPVLQQDRFDPAKDVYLNINAFTLPAPFSLRQCALHFVECANLQELQRGFRHHEAYGYY